MSCVQYDLSGWTRWDAAALTCAADLSDSASLSGWSAGELSSESGSPPRTYTRPLRPAVSALPEEGRQQAANHAAAEEAVQESDHPGVQDTGAGTHQHG